MKLIRSYNFWLSLSGAVGLFVVSIAKILGYSIKAEGVSEIIMSFCGILIVFGIVNKPKKEEIDLSNKDDNKNNEC